ncbi:nitrate reductase cytochrome c-type subunit [Shewanella intestini]|uniref:Periplasmic nitrate reductase, electron transfer subunit n=1 Tax=Shewanella intestini TaxID=2017544 RepID=A0ABS5I5D6_9GAMM|nr:MULTISPECIES: nitrate reductase cytochrome c-type subunit [Shewanella]MBR9729240.1 nitrate reductase cytochrome c-type subunit [Shewanella intestini]MRG35385.1 nitrate reductase cytochrome c-type subunit; periplasmic nitrate reductase electron transfer subunit [Shewanella sp. XMDDZSB0408]
MKTRKILSVIALVGLSMSAMAATIPADKVATLRQVPLDIEPTPPVMPKVDNTDVEKARSYPMQPPVIPHKIDGYQIDLKANKCMQCHSRQSSTYSKAPMVSVTHYMDRDNNFLATLSPRRYFCTQCHVPQVDAKPLVGNDFVDLHELMKKEK